MGNVFLNAQQMSTQLGIYLILSLPLHHALRSFQFINTSLENERAFILKPFHMLKKSSPIATNIQCLLVIIHTSLDLLHCIIFFFLNLLKVMMLELFKNFKN
jgi:hypothetical protein